MTLEEAIRHCEEKAKGCDACAEEHKELATWLKELLKRRKAAVEKVSDEWLSDMIMLCNAVCTSRGNFQIYKALYELKQRREAEGQIETDVMAEVVDDLWIENILSSFDGGEIIRRSFMSIRQALVELQARRKCGLQICRKVKKPWKPKPNEDYFVVANNGSPLKLTWQGGILGLASYAAGICFETREEVKAHGKEVLERLEKIYADGTPLTVTK